MALAKPKVRPPDEKEAQNSNNGYNIEDIRERNVSIVNHENSSSNTVGQGRLKNVTMQSLITLPYDAILVMS